MTLTEACKAASRLAIRSDEPTVVVNNGEEGGNYYEVELYSDWLYTDVGDYIVMYDNEGLEVLE